MTTRGQTTQKHPSDLQWIEDYHAASQSPVLLLCDHANNIVPPCLSGLGVDQSTLDRHIGWDIGIADVTRHLSDYFGCRAIFNHVSRLVIDANRRPWTPGSIPEVSDFITIPGNRDLEDRAIIQRIRHYFLPYHRRVSRAIAAITARGQIPLIVAMHSFTPSMQGQDRPWHIGVLRRGDDRVAAPVLDRLFCYPHLTIGDNQPYSGLRAFGYTINFHAQRPHFPHIMFELRQDEIDDRAGARAYADILIEVLGPTIGNSKIYQRYLGNNLKESRGLQSWRQASRFSV